MHKRPHRSAYLVAPERPESSGHPPAGKGIDEQCYMYSASIAEIEPRMCVMRKMLMDFLLQNVLLHRVVGGRKCR